MSKTANLQKIRVWSAADRKAFADLCGSYSESTESHYSRLIEITCDFLYWYEFINLFDAYFENLSPNDPDEEPLNVLRALKHMIAKSVHLEFFGLTDVSSYVG